MKKETAYLIIASLLIFALLFLLLDRPDHCVKTALDLNLGKVTTKNEAIAYCQDFHKLED